MGREEFIVNHFSERLTISFLERMVHQGAQMLALEKQFRATGGLEELYKQSLLQQRDRKCAMHTACQSGKVK